MTELVEGVALGTVSESKIECPFHDDKHVCDDAANELTGDATKLGKAIVSGLSTVVRKAQSDLRYERTIIKEDDPDDRDDDERELQLKAGDDNTWYPFGHQAHHLIPAKESLARASKLLTFVRKGKKACCPLAYNVNGNQNGVWLPGKHPVDGNGLNLWKGGGKAAADENRPPKPVAKGRGKDRWKYLPLNGRRPGQPGAFSDQNMRWLYVDKAMRALGDKRQFHDRHPTYSRAVQEHLDAIGDLLERFAGSRKRPPGCDECKPKKDGQRPPPLALLGVLNGLSAHYRTMVKGHTEHKTFYTSSWCDPDRKSGAAKPAVKKARVAKKR